MSHLYVVPLGQIETDLLNHLKQALWQKYGLPVSVAPMQATAGETFDRFRSQYNASLIISKLCRLNVGNFGKVLGVLDEDIFASGLNYVFGQAQLEGRCAVISLYRLRDNRPLLKERVVKEAVHELGHTFGLTHCSDPECVMFFSSTLGDTDRKTNEYCQAHQLELDNRLETLRIAG